ncbi:transposase [Kitasatospora purpeofusca]|nr:Tn3 family transposase [Kitasatospora purpeofusca]MCX4758613.1 transposase [Kitasatospora purpeofusca]WSR30946.1 transposase [Kitasatospora purpeofusca]
MLWTTRYLDAGVEQLRALPAEQREHQVLDEDVARLSPLKHANLNVVGRYIFHASGPAGGGLRPLGDPAEDADEDDEAGGD